MNALKKFCPYSLLCSHILINVLIMYVYMYGHTYSKSMDQPGKVANPARRGQLNREKQYLPVHVRT